MKASISFFPSGEAYLKLQCNTDWHQFPIFADKFLKKLEASRISSPTKGQAIDAHWYDFFWNEGQYRLVYGDWPPECLIETLSSDADLQRLCKAIESFEVG